MTPKEADRIMMAINLAVGPYRATDTDAGIGTEWLKQFLIFRKQALAEYDIEWGTLASHPVPNHRLPDGHPCTLKSYKRWCAANMSEKPCPSSSGN